MTERCNAEAEYQQPGTPVHPEHGAGGEAVVKAAVSSIAHLESLLGKLSMHGQTTTSIVLSSPFTSRIFTRPEEKRGRSRAV